MTSASNNLNAYLNKDTQFCISVASQPSNVGTTLHNAAYHALGLNFAYKSFATHDIKNTISGVRALGIRGCSISMPFKESVIPYLDELDESAQIIGAVNTVVNKDGCLIGYNTDALGAEIALKSIYADPSESVLLLGAGGVCRAILFALKKLGFKKAKVSNRNVQKINTLNSILPCEPVEWPNRHLHSSMLIINATSIGMHFDDEMPVNSFFVEKSRAVMDVVVSSTETKLIACARDIGKIVSPGYLMNLEQMMAQFTLYTKQPAPKEIIQRIWHNERSKNE